MAEGFLEEIYGYAKVIYGLENAVQKSRKWMDIEAVQGLNRILPDLYACIKIILSNDAVTGANVWNKLKTALQTESDLTQIADIIELDILPDMYSWMRRISTVDIEDGKGYCLKSTRSGFLTLLYNDNYMHSNSNPMLEADNLVESFYDPGKKDYYIYGSGLGYHVFQIYQRLAGYGRIVLFEPDPIVLEYAYLYGVLSWIPEGDIETRHFESGTDFFVEAKKCNAGVFIHPPSAHAIKDDSERNIIVSKWLDQHTRITMNSLGKINFLRNAPLGLPDVSELLNKLHCEEAVVVAAGPSVNEYWELLRSWGGKKLIVAVGKIYRSLLEEGIRPDIVVVTDPFPETALQIKGIEEREIPLVLAQAVHWEVARKYYGPQYMIYTEQKSMPMRDRRIEWVSGGTVSFTAMELAIHTDPRVIYLFGLDLGYPSEQLYAQGVTGQNQAGTAKLFDVESVNGGTLKTDYAMDRFRRNIEALIERTGDITFYNMSKQGALINGAKPFEGI